MAKITLCDRNKLRISNIINEYETEKYFEFKKKFLESKKRDLWKFDFRKRKPGTYKVYLIQGPLTMENIEFINNNEPENSIYILSDTKGQKSELLEKISDKTLFSVYGGFKDVDYLYAERTMHRPSTLARIVKMFEQFEEGIDPEWNDIEKCFYYYGVLFKTLGHMKDDDHWTIRYDKEHKEIATSLACMIRGKGVCAGKALVFKEAMDRIGIPCKYQNTEGLHDFNIVYLDGKWRGVDLTWDSVKKGFDNFATKSHDEFVNEYGHGGYSAPYRLESLFSIEEVRKAVGNYLPTSNHSRR